MLLLVCAIQIILKVCINYYMLFSLSLVWYRLYLTEILSESVSFLDIVIIIIIIMSVCSYKSVSLLSFMQIVPDFQEVAGISKNIMDSIVEL